MGIYLCLTLIVFGILTTPTFSITTDYLNVVCNVTSKTLETSLRLESNTAIAYAANTACFYHVITDASKVVFLVIRTFNLESTVNGACVDYVNIHDGANVNAATLNASPLCGRMQTISYFTSTSNQMTIDFVTDATGQSLGFEFLFSAATTGACATSQTACVNSSVCIDASLKCNTADECGDNTDEDGCTYPSTRNAETTPLYVIVLSILVGGIAFITCCILLGHYLWRNHIKWRWYLNKPISADKLELQPTTHHTAYPVTKVYYKERFQGMYEDVIPYQQSETQSYQLSIGGSDTRTSSQSFA